VRRAVEAGVSFFDTADTYSDGLTEEITGRLLAKLFGRRDDYVLATKVFFPMGPGPNDRGLSRKHVLAAIDDSLRRLGTDYVDLYQIHRWDDETPIEETMQALHDIVRAGKARYIGASSMYAWQFAKAQHTATVAGWTRWLCCVAPTRDRLKRRPRSWITSPGPARRTRRPPAGSPAPQRPARSIRAGRSARTHAPR
jgi:1-deoxyxylulose-5-phosphate synthase